MPTAKIDRFMLHVDTDLSDSPGSGPAITTVSAALTPPAHHRMAPYFVRPRHRGKDLRVGFKHTNTTGEHVEYAALSGPSPEAQSLEWEGEVEVGRTRLRTNGPAKARPLTVTQAPAAEVSRQITCEFWIVARRDWQHQTWKPVDEQWAVHPGDELHNGGCDITYNLKP